MQSSSPQHFTSEIVASLQRVLRDVYSTFFLKPLRFVITVCTSKFLRESESCGFVSDETEVLLSFCCTLEKIFYFGLEPRQSKLGFQKDAEPWTWLEKLKDVQNSTISFPYRSAVDRVLQNCTVQTHLGKFRLLVRLSLSSKCLHEPVQYLVENTNMSIFSLMCLIPDIMQKI